MKLSRVLPMACAAAIAVAAVFVYFAEIPIHKIESGRLSRLDLTTAPNGFTKKPSTSTAEQASSVPFSAFQSAAKKSPHSTGGWSITWTGGKSGANVASVLTLMLPSAHDAATVKSQAAQYYDATDSLKSQGYKYVSSFTVPSVSGSQGAVFRPSSGSSDTLAVVVFQDGRSVSAQYAGESTASAARTVASSLAAAQSSHLRAIGSGVSLRVTRWPLVASLVFWGVALALAVLVVVVPIGWRRARRLRRELHEHEARRAIHMRGAKTLKRRGARARSR